MFAKVADQIDVVTVSTPDHMHFAIACEAIRLGKPVMVQKPLCNTLWEARALANYAKEKGVLTVMGNQGATMGGTRVLREWIEFGLIGDVKEVYLPRDVARKSQNHRESLSTRQRRLYSGTLPRCPR